MSATSERPVLTDRANKVRTVFLAAPARTDTSTIRRILEEQGFEVSDSELARPGLPIRESLFAGVNGADAVVAVLGSGGGNSNVYYELGLADAMRKPVLVVADGTLDPSSDVAIYPYLRVWDGNEEALRFGLVRFLNAPRRGLRFEPEGGPMAEPLGSAVDDLLARLRADVSLSQSDLVELISSAIGESGVAAQATASDRFDDEKSLADIAVWSDELTSIVGGPFPIKVESSFTTPSRADAVAGQMTRAITAAKSRWGMLIYRDAALEAILAMTDSSVLAISAGEFLEKLRAHSFARIVTDMRNRAAHGVRVDG